MNLPDANVLLYATNSSSAHHQEARAWLERVLGGGEPVGFAWLVLLAFLRLSTKASVFARPLRAEQALDVVDDWLAQPAAVIVAPTERHAATLRRLLAPLGTAANLTSDAHLAALAIEHGGAVVSYDVDFSRFAGLTWRAPGDS